MNNIPIFTTEHGAASLVLREIPYRKKAYIKLLATQEPALLLEECIAFCRACGAEHIDAAGHSYLEKYPLTTKMLFMQRSKEGLAGADASLLPVTEATVEQWRALYNDRMAGVPNSAWMDSRDGKEMLQKGDGYFVYKDGTLLGLGRASGGMLDLVIATVPGAGETVVRALAERLTGETAGIEVASVNSRAIRLYARLGFVTVKEISSWYCVL